MIPQYSSGYSSWLRTEGGRGAFVSALFVISCSVMFHTDSSLFRTKSDSAGTSFIKTNVFKCCEQKWSLSNTIIKKKFQHREISEVHTAPSEQFK